MGRKASKATDNIYYIARTEAAENNDIFSSREKAALKLGIDAFRPMVLSPCNVYI